MTMTKNKLYHMVLAGILCAIGIVVPNVFLGSGGCVSMLSSGWIIGFPLVGWC